MIYKLIYSASFWLRESGFWTTVGQFNSFHWDLTLFVPAANFPDCKGLINYALSSQLIFCLYWRNFFLKKIKYTENLLCIEKFYLYPVFPNNNLGWKYIFRMVILSMPLTSVRQANKKLALQSLLTSDDTCSLHQKQ